MPFGVTPSRVAGPTVLHPGQFFVARPDTEYRRRRLTDQGEHSNWLWVDPAILEPLFGEQLSPDRWFAEVPRDLVLHVLRLFEDSFWDPRDPAAREASALSLVGRLAAVMASRRGQSPVPRSSHRRAIFDALSYLATNLDHRVELRELADIAQLSPAHFCVVFKHTTGHTVTRYARRLRLHWSMQRLTQSPSNLTSLALELGFSSHSHFGDRFRREFGLTPAQARQALVPPRSASALPKPRKHPR